MTWRGTDNDIEGTDDDIDRYTWWERLHALDLDGHISKQNCQGEPMYSHHGTKFEAMYNFIFCSNSYKIFNSKHVSTGKFLRNLIKDSIRHLVKFKHQRCLLNNQPFYIVFFFSFHSFFIFAEHSRRWRQSPAFSKLRQEDHEMEASLVYILNSKTACVK